MSDLLQDNTRDISTVAFGKNFGSWMVVFKDGGWAYEDIPRELTDEIEHMSSSQRSDFKACALGPDDEYFLATRGGLVLWAGGHRMLDEIRDSHVGDRMRSIVFGEGDTYLLRYT